LASKRLGASCDPRQKQSESSRPPMSRRDQKYANFI
jgi:hypothetical protein